MHKLIAEHCNAPQALLTQVDMEVIGDIRKFDGNDRMQKVVETEETTMIIEQYAVSAWFRWADDLEVPQETVF